MSLFPDLAFLKKSQFIRNVAKVSSGRLSAMIIGIVATPIVSRLFDPEDYGVAAVVIAAIGITAILLPLSLERAVLYPKENSKAGQVLVLALFVSTFMAFFVYAILGICLFIWPDAAERSGMGVFFWIFPIGGLLVALRGIATIACIRNEQFTTIAAADVTDAAVNSSTRILWGVFLTSSTVGLLFGYLLGVIVAASICSIHLFRLLLRIQTPITVSSMRSVLIEFRDYPIFRAPARFAFSAAERLPVIALGLMFPAATVGFFAMANRAAALPLQAASQSIKDVLLRKIMGYRQNDQPMAQSLVKVAIVLGITGAPMFLVLFLFGEELLSWILGDRWASAGRVVEILTPYLFIVWMGSFTSTVFETLRLNQLRLKMYVSKLLVRIGIFVFAGFAQMDFEETLWLFVAVSCAFQLLIYTIAVRVVVMHDQSLPPDATAVSVSQK